MNFFLDSALKPSKKASVPSLKREWCGRFVRKSDDDVFLPQAFPDFPDGFRLPVCGEFRMGGEHRNRELSRYIGSLLREKTALTNRLRQHLCMVFLEIESVAEEKSTITDVYPIS